MEWDNMWNTLAKIKCSNLYLKQFLRSRSTMKVGSGTFHYLWFKKKCSQENTENVQPIKRDTEITLRQIQIYFWLLKE